VAWPFRRRATRKRKSLRRRTGEVEALCTLQDKERGKEEEEEGEEVG